MKTRTVSSNVAYLERNDSVLKCNCVANSISVYLNPSRDYQESATIIKIDDSTNAVTIYPHGSETIDGAASVTLSTENDRKILVPVDGGWAVSSDSDGDNVNGGIVGESGKRYKAVACVLRNTGAGWFAITDTDHAPLNISSITNDVNSVDVNFNFTARKVVSFVATPDETMAQQGYSMGASVGKTQAQIKIGLNRTVQGYVSYNGSSWTVGSGSVGITSASFSGGILTITHEAINSNAPNGSASCRNGVYIASIGTTGSTTTQVYITDYAGAPVATADTNMRIFFSRVHANQVDPNNYTDAGGNIWCFGIMEV